MNLRLLAILTPAVSAFVATAADRTAQSPSPPAPRNPAELASRMEQLRARYAPFLASRPAAANLRLRQDLCGDDWLSRFEVKRVSDTPANSLAPRPPSPGWEAPELALEQWERTTVPEWRYDSLARMQPASCILWYRKSFAATKPAAGARVFLVFEGVDWEAEVWLNGKRLGGHSVYFEPFRFEVTDCLAESNTLAVRVIDGPQFGEPAAYWAVFPVPPAADQRYVRDRARSLQGFRNGDTHNGSGYGIHREVYLETTAPAILTEVLVRGNPAGEQVTVRAAADVAGDKPSTLKVEVLPENFDGPVFRCEQPFAPDGEGRQVVSLAAPGARRWSPEAPWLYRCRVSLLDGAGRVVDVRDALFGHRSLSMASESRPRPGLQPGTLLLDGVPLFLRGANIQGLNALWFWGERDRLLTALLLLKAADFNAVRSCQHVAFPEVRELQDRLGILSQQDVGSRYPKLGEQVRPALIRAAAALARACHNNPGVVLLSFANETEFDPAALLRAALAVDPDRIFKPISGHPHGGAVYPHEGRSGYALPDDLWAHVIDDVHPYWGWYGFAGQAGKWCQVLPPGRMVTVGEYGSEALDSYETMARYPEHWGPRPPRDADQLWGQVQVAKDDARQRAGLRGRTPSCLGDYIAASQNYQSDQLSEVTKSWRLSPRRIAGYFQFHFLDVLPANWPKSIVSHDLAPKRGYFAMAQVNQPLVPLPKMIGEGSGLEVWVANDLAQSFPGCVAAWEIRSGGKRLSGGEFPVHVPASDAVLAGAADLSGLPPGTGIVDVELALRGGGGCLARYSQEFYRPAYASRKVTFDFRGEMAAWVEAETAAAPGQGSDLQADSSKADLASGGANLAVHADRHPGLAPEWVLELAAALPKPQLLVRHAGEKAVQVRLVVAGAPLGTATLEPTPGWGYRDTDWAWSAVALPKDLAAGRVSVRLEIANRAPVNLDCVALSSAAVRPPRVRAVRIKPASLTGPAAPLSIAGFPSFGSFEEMANSQTTAVPPVRAVTSGPKFHWFGYYDKFQLDPANRRLLCMEVDFEHRLPGPDERVQIGMVDLQGGEKWIGLGESRAWCWQQGCMLQWRPGSDREVVWNDREGDRFVCRVLDVQTRKLRTLPRAIGSISPDGKTAVCEDFSRIWNFRPGYAYAGVPDRFVDEPAPAGTGVWRMDMDSGESRLLISVAEMAKIPYPGQSASDRHYVNHLSWSPDGKRFLFYNRWSGKGQPTRVFTADSEGRDLRLLSSSGASHWTWRDPEHVLIWAGGGYRLYKDDGSGEPKETLWEAPNGHQTYVPGTNNTWLVTDTYPTGKDRDQILYLHHLPSGRFVLLGRFPSAYGGEWRCDSHPRVSRDGKRVIIDSPHGGNGRQQYVVDIGALVGAATPSVSSPDHKNR